MLPSEAPPPLITERGTSHWWPHVLHLRQYRTVEEYRERGGRASTESALNVPFTSHAVARSLEILP